MTTNEMIGKRMVELVMNNPDNFWDDLETNDFESLFETCYEFYFGEIANDDHYEEVLNSVEINNSLTEIRWFLRDLASSRKFDRQDALRYYGVRA